MGNVLILRTRCGQGSDPGIDKSTDFVSSDRELASRLSDEIFNGKTERKSRNIEELLSYTF